MDSELPTLTAKYTWGPRDRVAYRKATEFHRANFAPMTSTQHILQLGVVALLSIGTMYLTLFLVDSDEFFRIISEENYDALRYMIKSKVLIASWIITTLAILSNAVFYRSVMSSYFNIFKGKEYYLEMNSEGILLSSNLEQQTLSWTERVGVKIWKSWLFVATPNMSFVIPVESMNMPVDDALEAVKTWANAKAATPSS